MPSKTPPPPSLDAAAALVHHAAPVHAAAAAPDHAAAAAPVHHVAPAPLPSWKNCVLDHRKIGKFAQTFAAIMTLIRHFW
jgi:hypothetical protein